MTQNFGTHFLGLSFGLVICPLLTYVCSLFITSILSVEAPFATVNSTSR